MNLSNPMVRSVQSAFVFGSTSIRIGRFCVFSKATTAPVPVLVWKNMNLSATRLLFGPLQWKKTLNLLFQLNLKGFHVLKTDFPSFWNLLNLICNKKMPCWCHSSRFQEWHTSYTYQRHFGQTTSFLISSVTNSESRTWLELKISIFLFDFGT